MDAGVYDHIQEEVLKREADGVQSTSKPGPGADSTAGGEGNGSKDKNDNSGAPISTEEPGDLTTDLQETYRSFQASPWGVKIGGLWGSVNKQAASYLSEATREATAARETAFKGFADLKTSLEGRARSLSNDFAGAKQQPGEGGGGEGDDAKEGADAKGKEKEGTSTATTASTAGEGAAAEEDASSPAFIARFRSEASRRLQDLQKAEDAADEALLKFGTNIRNFLRDAVTVTPPSEGAAQAKDGGAKGGAVLFESKDADGKRVIHTTRFDAQLHVIHCSLDSFTKDPASAEYDKWSAGFDIDSRTEQIAQDLKKYEELRKAMEKLVPEKVDYPTFWKRYYFLRMVIESEEARRREMLKAAANKPDDADLAWDSDDEGPSTPQPRSSTDKPAADTPLASSGHLKEPRKSNDEKSTAGSDASYDLVSGATSAAPGSPQEKKDDKKKKDDSEDEDWE